MIAREGTDGPSGADGDFGAVMRWGVYSIGINLVLIALHGLVALASGSLAVTAELLHNFVDLASAVAVVGGLRLAARKSRHFPYGLYKVENLVAAGLAVTIFFTAYEIASGVVLEGAETPRSDLWMLALLAVTMAVPLAFSHWEMRVARRTNSPALMADAREYRVHAYTTGLAFAALLAVRLDWPVDRFAALVIVVAVVKTGWDLLVDALRVLLDASLDAQSLGEVRRMIEADPAVVAVQWVTGRNAGRFRFVEAGVTLRLHDLAKAEAAIRRIEADVRAALPAVERLLLQVEPSATARVCYAVPVADLSGTISGHFGEAPYFAFVTLDREGGAVEEQRLRINPWCGEARGKGLRTAEWLAQQKVDRVILPKRLEGKGPAYVFAEAGIVAEVTSAGRLADLFPAAKAPG